MKLLMANLVSIICILAAIGLMWCGVQGWGWLLLVACIFGHTMGNGKKKERDSE